MHYLRQAGLKAAARSALPDARVWFEQALGVLAALPESHPRWSRPSRSASSCDRCWLSSVRSGWLLERLREAEASPSG